MASRVRKLNAAVSGGDGPVVYWMSRDQRMRDNYALLHAQHLAAAAGGRPVVVIFNLVKSFLEGTIRHFGFMLRGLEQGGPVIASLSCPLCPMTNRRARTCAVARDLEALGITFVLLQGDAVDNVSQFVARSRATALVSRRHTWRCTTTSAGQRL
jgi:deoxyribodipyrimidine photo-lyase